MVVERVVDVVEENRSCSMHRVIVLLGPVGCDQYGLIHLDS